MTFGGHLIQALFIGIFAAVLVGWFSRPATDPKAVASWAAAHSLTLTSRNEAMVTYYVRLSITLRVIGGVSGLVLGSLFDDATGLNTSAGPGFWIWVILGWMLGTGWAELRLTRPSGAALVASLTPRSVGDYLSRGLYAAPAIAAAIGLVAVAAALLAPDAELPQIAPPPTAALLAAAGGVVVIAASVVLAIRAVVARRQPIGDDDVVAADDAIRASAVHNLAGAGTAAVLLVAAQVSGSALSPYHAPFGVRGWVPLLLVVAALISWRGLAFRGWRVRRAPQSDRELAAR